MKIDILQKVEGEVYLHYFWDKDIIEDVEIKFEHYRGFEKLLVGKDPLDALVINPRICGICGHAHLRATAEALEDAFKIVPPKKAKIIREITTLCEVVQNHLKWFYLVIVPFVGLDTKFLTIQPAIVAVNKIIALFGGQYPHSSYMLPGGVTCDPSYIEIYKAKNYLEYVKDIIRSNLLCEPFDINNMKNEQSDFGDVFRYLLKFGKVGQSYDRYVVFGKSAYVDSVKILKTVKKSISTKYIEENNNAIKYRGKMYETGPLARMIVIRHPLVMQLHRRYKDALITRVSARIVEIDIILKKIEYLLDTISLEEPSYISSQINDGYGEGIVEAARGSLLHRIWIKDRKIDKYQIITPTQWNLLQGTKKEPGVARKAIRGLRDKQLAELIFRSFDICSVCTTH
ncbi:nickel-dependent hydrogenase large subunit [Nitrosophilus kaiyonis]|uniref:nickel-dependent hydrogenase large subunit n=1 Tax=Nitrosophilus kaiyonis TaxID=2930200 RepID=UPI00248FF3D5|nr:nickel-dependent hydrogenase large subunit [Nitrosophilus kaiyonis]